MVYGRFGNNCLGNRHMGNIGRTYGWHTIWTQIYGPPMWMLETVCLYCVQVAQLSLTNPHDVLHQGKWPNF